VDFLRRLIEAVPCRVHTVLTDNGTHFTDPTGDAGSPAEIRDLGIIPKAPLTDSWRDSHEARFLTLLAREIRAMPSAVRLREDYSAGELRTLARRSKDVSQSRRLLSLAAVRDGMDRAAAAKIGGMDRQTLRDWVHRFNASGPEGLIDNRTEGPKPRLSEEQLAQLAKIVEAGPDREKDGVVRWRRVDLKRVIAERFGVDFHPRYVGKLLRKLGFSHISARPRHPAQDERIVEGFKKTSRAR
jgi:transposase